LKSYVLKPLAILGILIIAYSILLTLAYMPNPSRLEYNIGSAIHIVEKEGIYRHVVYAFSGRGSERNNEVTDEIFYAIAGEPDFYARVAMFAEFWHLYSGTVRLDNFTDRIMLGQLRRQDGLSAFENAFTGYSRYWHGYVAVLRPVMAIFDFGTVRYIALFHQTLLIVAVSVMISKRLDMIFSLLFGFALATFSYNIFPFSLQFSSVFYVMLYAMLISLCFEKRLVHDDALLLYFFLVVGSITNFFDLLTAPLLTLGIPLVLCHTLRNNHTGYIFKENVKTIILCSIYWGVGYAFTWIGRWIISYFVDPDIQVFSAISYRMIGTDETPLSYVFAFGGNIITMFPFVLLATIIVLVAVLTGFIVKTGLSKNHAFNTSPVLLLCLAPYAWFFVFANHSEVHYWFTYRIQAIAVFALLAFLINLLNLQKIRMG